MGHIGIGMTDRSSQHTAGRKEPTDCDLPLATGVFVPRKNAGDSHEKGVCSWA